MGDLVVKLAILAGVAVLMVVVVLVLLSDRGR